MAERWGLEGDRPVHNLLKREKKKVTSELHLHSDKSAQYTSQAYFELTQQYGITPSMSRRENPYDNAMAENFFSILKTECIYRHNPATFSEANEMIDRYIHFYNHSASKRKQEWRRWRYSTPAKAESSYSVFCAVPTIQGGSIFLWGFWVCVTKKIPDSK